MISTGLGVVSGLFAVFDIVLTIIKQGHAGGIVGYFEFASALLAVVGLIIGIISWQNEDRLDTFKRSGVGLCGLMVLINIFILILGIKA